MEWGQERRSEGGRYGAIMITRHPARTSWSRRDMLRGMYPPFEFMLNVFLFDIPQVPKNIRLWSPLGPSGQPQSLTARL